MVCNNQAGGRISTQLRRIFGRSCQEETAGSLGKRCSHDSQPTQGKEGFPIVHLHLDIPWLAVVTVTC